MPEVSLDQTQTAAANGAGKTKKPRGTVTRNASVVAIAKISGILDALEADTRTGVLEFINSQY